MELREESKLYPDLTQQQPTAPNVYNELEAPQSFRLYKINEIQKILENERDTRAKLVKKYQRGINVTSGLT